MNTTPTPAAPRGPVSYFSAGMLIVKRISRATYPSATEVGIEFLFDPADPTAITLIVHIHIRGEQLHPQWRFAREMLDHGRVGPVGDGDVRIAPRARWAELCLRLPAADRTLVLSVERIDIEGALEATEALVPLAAPDPVPDPAAVDAELAAILAEGSR